jgi:hypothetical protein
MLVPDAPVALPDRLKFACAMLCFTHVVESDYSSSQQLTVPINSKSSRHQQLSAAAAAAAAAGQQQR